MLNFNDLFGKNSLNILGILSGTSVDSVDIIYVNFSSSDNKITYLVKNFDSFPVNTEIKEYILKISNNNGNTEDVCKVNFLIGKLFADCINKFLKKHNINKDSIDLIGSHGQTIHHIPQLNDISDYSFKSTLQVGDISVISNLTGIHVVGDFRTADVALEGEGAPLASYVDYKILSSESKNRLLINLGGISNISYVPKNISLDEDDSQIISFDCGPANMLIDLCMKFFYGKDFDINGDIASSGKINPELLNYLILTDKFHTLPYPKSTGRELYNEIFNLIITHYKNLKPEDVIRTVSEFSVHCLKHNIDSFIPGNIDEIIISGGGAKNKFIMNRMNEIFSVDGKTVVRILNENGLNSENKEAFLFALLAYEFINGRKANLPSVTGAKRKTILGKLSIV
ncbi:MAG: anhydro-N-acetylmuramic acid kinase [Ignavibacteria bacterium]|nr:anhydro-N-acetylmuramic acid kinase [Ignavibacteria bacterium]